MRIDISRIPQPLIEAVNTGNLIPFIGAGISRHANRSDGNEFPTWEGFLRKLADLLALGEWTSPEDVNDIRQLIDGRKHLMAAQALKEVIPKDALHQHIEAWFDADNVDVSPIHRALLHLGAPLIITTNYDRLLEKACAAEFGHAPICYTYSEAPQVQQLLKSHRHHYARPAIFKIHGTSERPNDIVFAEMDYRKLIYRQPGYRAVLSAVFVTKVVLMLGFSYSDPELSLLSESLREYFDERSTPDFIVLKKGQRLKVEKMRLRSDYGLEVLEYEDFSEVVDLVEALAKLGIARTLSV